MSFLLNWLDGLHQEIMISNQCARKKCVYSKCRQCMDHCPKGAIGLLENAPIVDLEKCTSCGECILVCPLSAIEGNPPVRELFENNLVFDESYTPFIKELLIARKMGMTSVLVKNTPLNEKWRTVLTKVNEILAALQIDVITIERWENKKLTRRKMIQAFQKEGKRFAFNMAPIKWKTIQAKWKLATYYPDVQFYEVEWETTKCTICQACFHICPEKVFSLDESTFVIDHIRCVNCQLCMNVCEKKALTILPNIKKKCRNVKSISSVKCSNCGKIFFAFEKRTKCHICENRDPSWLKP